MTKFIIKYEYIFHDSDCPCCQWSEQNLTFYDNECERNTLITEVELNIWVEDEDDLRRHINEHYPEYNDFSVHPDTRWF